MVETSRKKIDSSPIAVRDHGEVRLRVVRFADCLAEMLGEPYRTLMFRKLVSFCGGLLPKNAP